MSETQGGVIYSSLATIEIINSVFQNSQTKDGGFFYLNQTTIIIINCEFNEGIASNGNSAFTILKSNISMYSSNFSNIYHYKTSEYSIISISNAGAITIVNIKDCIFIDNGLNTQYGFYISGVLTLTISVNIFEKNQCSQNIFLYNSNIIMNDSNFTNNYNDILLYFLNDAEKENIFQINNIKFEANQINFTLMKVIGNNKITFLNIFFFIILFCLF